VHVPLGEPVGELGVRRGCRLLLRRLKRLDRDGRLLTGELASPLLYLTIGVGLLGASSRSLPLPKSASSLKGEAGVRPRCQRPQRNYCHGLSGRIVL
jgi:hypothetical protein